MFSYTLLALTQIVLKNIDICLGVSNIYYCSTIQEGWLVEMISHIFVDWLKPPTVSDFAQKWAYLRFLIREHDFPSDLFWVVVAPNGNTIYKGKINTSHFLMSPLFFLDWVHPIRA